MSEVGSDGSDGSKHAELRTDGDDDEEEEMVKAGGSRPSHLITPNGEAGRQLTPKLWGVPAEQQHFQSRFLQPPTPKFSVH